MVILEWLIGGVIFTNDNLHRNEFDWWSHIIHRSYIHKSSSVKWEFDGKNHEFLYISSHLKMGDSHQWVISMKWESPIFDGIWWVISHSWLISAESPIFDGIWSISKLVDSAALHETDGCCLIFFFQDRPSAVLYRGWVTDAGGFLCVRSAQLPTVGCMKKRWSDVAKNLWGQKLLQLLKEHLC